MLTIEEVTPGAGDLYQQSLQRRQRKMERVRLEVSIRVFFDSMGYKPEVTESMTQEAMQMIDKMIG